jgi:hypothetical protein
VDYQLKMIRTITLLILSCFIASVAFAASSVKTPDGINFNIRNAALGESGNLKYVVIDLLLTNESDTKKIDSIEKYQYILSDEFGNSYRALQRPAAYKDLAEKMPASFPSMYPGEFSAKVLFFEAPVAKSRRLKFEIKGAVDNAPLPLLVEFQTPVPDPKGPSAVEIASPEDGTVITAGSVFPLNVNVNSDDLPFKIIVVAFSKTLENDAPAESNTYNITIPADTIEGPSSISVIGYWTDPVSGKKKILSKDVVIYVTPGQPASR